MATLQIRGIDNRLYDLLKKLANNEKRSISQEVIHIIQAYLSNPNNYSFDPTSEFLKLSGSWDDERSADEIVADLTNQRENTKRFLKNIELFD